MVRAINRTRAEGAAWRLTQEYCLDTPGPTPVEDIAMDHGVICLEAKLTGCLARLVRKGGRGIIRTKADIREPGRKRFAIAHELGHWFLHETESQYFICTAEQMRDYKGSPLEVEANIFASELLMPTFLFRPLAQDAAPCLDSIGNLAAKFGTSLTATGIKFVDLNRHECVLVLSTDRKVTWSKQKGNRSGLRIDKGMVLHRDSLAQHITDPKGTLGPTSVAPEVWITHNWYERQIEMTEESWTLDGYNAVLTLLVIADADEPEEEDMVGHYEKRIKGS
jgi:Zn-dependent peptidase ImmA (M78 family)